MSRCEYSYYVTKYLATSFIRGGGTGERVLTGGTAPWPPLRTASDSVITIGSPRTLVFGDVKMLRKFDGNHPKQNNFLMVHSFSNV